MFICDNYSKAFWFYFLIWNADSRRALFILFSAFVLAAENSASNLERYKKAAVSLSSYRLDRLRPLLFLLLESCS
jgi:hypothetical protein